VDEETALRIIGYGQPRLDRVVWSSERSVQLVTETELEEDRLHSYRIPVPPAFLLCGLTEPEDHRRAQP
jgi:hypothetical protein